MNRRTFLKRAIGMGAVVAGLAALPKSEAKAVPAVPAVPAESQADGLVNVTGYINGQQVGATQQYARVWRKTHDQPWTLDFSAPGHAAVLDVDPFTLTDVSTSGPIHRLTLPSREERALERQIARNQDALSTWTVETRVDPRIALEPSSPRPFGVAKTINADGSITVEFRG